MDMGGRDGWNGKRKESKRGGETHFDKGPETVLLRDETRRKAKKHPLERD